MTLTEKKNFSQGPDTVVIALSWLEGVQYWNISRAQGAMYHMGCV